jgi:beta-galactosidase
MLVRAAASMLPQPPLLPLLLLLLLLTPHAAQAKRTEALFNHEWLFHLGDLPDYVCSTPASGAVFPIDLRDTVVQGLDDIPAANGSAAECAAACASNCSCQAWQWCPRALSYTECASSSSDSNDACQFPQRLDGLQCSGLHQAVGDTEAACAASCCGEDGCQVYQFCDSSGCGGRSCWIGQVPVGGCNPSKGWLSGARNVTPVAVCRTGLLADYGPGNWVTSDQPNWVGAARLAPPAPPTQVAGPGAIAYDESLFESVMLPHDYLARVAPSNVNVTPHQEQHGNIPFSNAWYRRHFSVPEGTTLARLYFDGAYRSASVFLNGALAAQHEEGYTGFSVWLHNVSGAPLVVGGGDNVVAVYLASTIYTYELWGYEGAGIERDVSLVLHDSLVSVAPWGVIANASVAGAVSASSGPDGPLSADASVAPSVDIANAGDAAAIVTVTAVVLAPGGALAGSTAANATLQAGGWARLTPPPVLLRGASLWSPANSPTATRRPIYTLVVTVTDSASGAVLDATNVTFGVRNVTFDADLGLFVNGFPTKLRGFSNHQDFAGTGTFVPPNVQAYRVQRVLDVGGNAWRTAHNPVDSRLLDELDARGVLVWSENRFLRDFDVYVRDAGDMVARDRNHPSIVLWSLCNENGCGEYEGFEGSPAGQLAGAMLAQRFMAHMKSLDDTRPITANPHNTLGQNGSILAVLDVMGLTYDYASLPKMHQLRPSAPLLNGESASCQSDRGSPAEGGSDVADAMACSQASWATADASAWDAGAFVWSGFDYRGETGWPSVVCYYGVLDLCGFDKGVADWYRVWWGLAAGWPGARSQVLAPTPWVADKAGAPVKVTAVAAGASVQLSVNGAVVGERQPLPRLGSVTFPAVPFAAGNYTVTSFDDSGAPLGSFTAVTPGQPAALRAVVDWPGSAPGGALAAGRRDAALVAVSVVDAAGVVVRGAAGAVSVSFSVDGPGELLGLGNGDHTNHLPGQGVSVMPTYDGLMRAILRGTVANGTPLRLTATADGLAPATVEVQVV